MSRWEMQKRHLRRALTRTRSFRRRCPPAPSVISTSRVLCRRPRVPCPVSYVPCLVSCVLCLVSCVLCVQLADGFNGADLRNIGTEAGLFAIRADRDYVLEVRQDLQGRRVLASRASLRFMRRFPPFCRSVGNVSIGLLLWIDPQ